MVFNYDKYRGVIISIALFLILDASVLILNFYTSFQIAKDAVAVNLAGRQRMLSQRMMKSILDLQVSLQDAGQSAQPAIDELTKTTKLFDETLNSFTAGGKATGASGEPVVLEAVKSSASVFALREAKLLWDPFNQQIQQLFSEVNQGDTVSVQQALVPIINYGKANNLSLLKLMNDLTVDLEGVAKSKASRLRTIQVIGIGLAVLNFFIIMFHFMRQLRESDEKVEEARNETKQILNTVDQGLFLLDKDLQMGAQYSNEMNEIFGYKRIAGREFPRFIREFISSKDLENVQSFVRLLFNPRKKQRLLGDLNPLREVSVQVPDTNNRMVNKFLRFSFARVSDEKNAKVLTTVSDITEEVTLAKKLETANKRNEQQLEMLSVLLKSNPDMMPLFIENSFTAYNKINQILKSPAKTKYEYKQKANDIFSLLHNVKGEASALSLTMIAELCHEFEEKIKVLVEREDLRGKDFLGLTILLNELVSYNTTFKELFSKVYSAQLNAPTLRDADKKQDWQHLSDLAQKVAKDQLKQVELVTSGLNDFVLSDSFVSLLNTVSIQFIRNAIVHGIETPADRTLSEKPETGLLKVSLCKRANGFYQYTFSDDGLGIDRNKVRAAALEKNIIDEYEAETMLPTQIINLIFSPQLSTSSGSDMNSGQGIGMYGIKQTINEIGGKLSIKTSRGRGCDFVVMFPASVNKLEKNAA